MEKRNVILEKSFEFALALITYCEELENAKKYVISKQLLKAGTSIGANIRESQSCESRADFIHKLKIAAKEAAETEFWLLLCQYSKTYPKNEILISTLKEIQKLLSSIISTSKKGNQT
jgi:four helix bundle protein